MNLAEIDRQKLANMLVSACLADFLRNLFLIEFQAENDLFFVSHPMKHRSPALRSSVSFPMSAALAASWRALCGCVLLVGLLGGCKPQHTDSTPAPAPTAVAPTAAVAASVPPAPPPEAAAPATSSATASPAPADMGELVNALEKLAQEGAPMAQLEAVVEAFNTQQYKFVPDRSVRTPKGDYFPDDDGRRPLGFKQAQLKGQTAQFVHLETATVMREYTGQPIDDGKTTYDSDLIAKTAGGQSHSIPLMLWPLGNDQIWVGTPAEDSCIGQQHGGRAHVIWVGAQNTLEKVYDFTHPEYSDPQITDVSPLGLRGAAITVKFTQGLAEGDPAARGVSCDIGSPERHLEKRIDLRCGNTACTRRERVIKVVVGCPEVGGCD